MSKQECMSVWKGGTEREELAVKIIRVIRRKREGDGQCKCRLSVPIRTFEVSIEKLLQTERS